MISPYVIKKMVQLGNQPDQKNGGQGLPGEIHAQINTNQHFQRGAKWFLKGVNSPSRKV